MMARDHSRLDRALATGFIASRLPLPFDCSEHCYTEAREYPSRAAALEAILAPGFFDSVRTHGLRAGDHIVLQVGAASASAWHGRLAVAGVPAKVGAVTVTMIGELSLPEVVDKTKERKRA